MVMPVWCQLFKLCSFLLHAIGQAHKILKSIFSLCNIVHSNFIFNEELIWGWLIWEKRDKWDLPSVSLTLSWGQENPKEHCGCRACLPSTSLLTLLTVLVHVGVVWRTTKTLSGLKQSGPLHKYMSLPPHPGRGISIDSCQNWTYGGGMKAPHGMGCGETPRRERYLWDLLKHSRDANFLYSWFMWWVKNILHGGTVWRQMAKMLHSTEMNCHPHAKALLPPPAKGKLRR